MISNQLLQQIASIRRTDNGQYCENLVEEFEIFENLRDEEYFTLTQSLLLVINEFMEDNQAQNLQLKNTTKYLAKKYFDIYSTKFPQNTFKKGILVIITCLRTAVKFNQILDVSQQYTLQYCFHQSRGQYQREQFLECEIELLRILRFRLNISTPYDFMIVQSLLPHLDEAMGILVSIVDFSLTLTELKGASAEGIFFGALIYSCRSKKENLIAFEIIRAITYRWEEAFQIAGIVDDSIKRLLQE